LVPKKRRWWFFVTNSQKYLLLTFHKKWRKSQFLIRELELRIKYQYLLLLCELRVDKIRKYKFCHLVESYKFLAVWKFCFFFKISFFDRNFFFCSKFHFLTKILIFGGKFPRYTAKNFELWPSEGCKWVGIFFSTATRRTNSFTNSFNFVKTWIRWESPSWVSNAPNGSIVSELIG